MSMPSPPPATAPDAPGRRGWLHANRWWLPGALVLGETLETRHLIGMALIGSGLAALDGRPLRWLKPAPATNG